MSVDFSSWPREQEQTFQVYEQSSAASQKLAWTVAGSIAGVFFLFAVGVYAGVAPVHKDVTKDMNMSNLSKKKGAEAPAPAPAAAPAPAPAPAADPAPAAAPEAETK